MNTSSDSMKIIKFISENEDLLLLKAGFEI